MNNYIMKPENSVCPWHNLAESHTTELTNIQKLLGCKCQYR